MKREPPTKRLLDSELRTRLDKGLCFRCNDKWSRGHRCKVRENRELMLCIMNDEVETDEEGEIESEENEIMELKSMELGDDTEISLRSLHGFSEKGTIKLKGKIKGREVVNLNNSGAPHNFIRQKIVWELGLPVVEGTKFGVTIGDSTTNIWARHM